MAAGAGGCPIGQREQAMNKILMALTILGTGAGCFLTARQATTQSQHTLNLTQEAWRAEAQLFATAASERTGLTDHIRELKHALSQPQKAVTNALWAALQTNSVGHFPPEMW